MTFKLVDSKVANRGEFDNLEAARSGLSHWIEKQRAAGEPVVELPDGQWSDSRITIWITDDGGNVRRLKG